MTSFKIVAISIKNEALFFDLSDFFQPRQLFVPLTLEAIHPKTSMPNIDPCDSFASRVLVDNCAYNSK